MTLKMDYLQTHSDQGKDDLGSSLDLLKTLNEVNCSLPSTRAHSA